MTKGRSRMKTNNPNAGFTLIEAVLSIAILAIISLPLLSYFTDSLRYSSMMSRQQQAMFLAQDITEGLLAENRLVTKVTDEDAMVDGDGCEIEGYTVPFLADKDKKGYHLDEITDDFLLSGKGSVSFTSVLPSLENVEDGYVVDVTITSDESLDNLWSFEEYGLDSSTDVIYIDSTENTQAVFELMAAHNTYVSKDGAKVPAGMSKEVTEETIRDNLSREMYVDLFKEDDGYRVKIRYAYSCFKVVNKDGAAPGTWESTVLMNEKVEDLLNIYLVYDWCKMNDTVIIKANDMDTEELLRDRKLGLNIICRMGTNGDNEPVSPYMLTVKVLDQTDKAFGMNLPGHTNLKQDRYQGAFIPSVAGTPESGEGGSEIVKPISLMYTIETRVYSERDEERNNLLAEITTKKGE